MTKIVTIVGARPQFIKASAISRVLRSMGQVEEVLVHTGQHYDENMSGVFFGELEIPRPSYDLGIGSGPHGVQTGRMLEEIERVLLEEKPDWVLVYGDTNSTLAGALAAAKLHIPVAHVEAGLRSFNRKLPEEVNRVVTDHLSDVLFAPTEAAVENLRSEGIAGGSVHLVGDVMYDVALQCGKRAEETSVVLQTLELAPQEYILATIHRVENTDDPVRLRAVFEGLSAVAAELPVILPLHPRTRAALERERLLERFSDRIRFVEPLAYLDMLALQKNARLIVTDSGGVQKEAFFCGVECVTLRNETEWVELVDLGWNHVIPPTDSRVVSEGVFAALGSALPSAEVPKGLYGGGEAATRIIEILTR